ncbi:hypothetical protein Tco_0706550 [Tanacetum coccineum]|uniref:Reverse transcriptase domain-containing protein n=1 Tax=Tanacetum coccineum TaxID=301880 RepID=A0ABQ4Y7P8_9ASTR
MEKYYNARVRSTSFRIGDLVYRNNEASRAEDGGKLGPKWEGPYEVTEVLGKGAYKLRDCNGNALPRTWNSLTEIGGMELAEAKVVDKAVVVPVAPGTLMEVLTKPTRFQTDKGLDKGVQTPRRADRFSVIFALILSTQE